VAVSRFNPDYPDAGLRQVVPTSVVVGSGSASFNGNGTITGSGVSSLSVNGIFTSSYDKYLINITHSGATAAWLKMRFRESGSDITTGYYGASFQYNYIGGTSNDFSRNNGIDMYLGQSDSNFGNSSWGILTSEKGPAGAARTTFIGQSWGAATPNQFGYGTTSGSADGFTLYPDTGIGNITVYVYGFRN
jgi:hypothetical protein